MAIKIMIVDDSAVVRQVLSSVLNEAPDLTVMAVASDPIFARNHLKKQWPDVIILDIEMPRMDGLTFLREIMAERPTPVVICSSLAAKGCELSLQALSAGAVDIVTKPQLGLQGFLQETKLEFWQIIRAASQAKIARQYKPKATNILIEPIKDITRMAHTTDRIAVIGTSTGGTQALEFILAQLPRTCQGLAVVQHMPEKFTAAFAARLNDLCEVEVKEAESGDRLIPGRVLIAPGGHHLEIQRSGAQYIAKVFRGPAVNRHCPSVDVLFRSVAKNVGKNAMGVIMTGMGDDGAQGLLAMRKVGSETIAQDEASSVVFGMPKEAINIGAASQIASLNDIPKLLNH
ncbi:chemotaxis response regulator protein-glutamate methylesterase [Oceanicoccus sp. KOV_DT_Chl]|uniref:protein-glutamate methylesterase/protein-glutamine glutaminase n=1 Tax=Oceanicoccus sp. KOV_DT_Chl TaxID=1904639 RepID=UPI000C7E0CC4|nr:chemotaxis response regulator protein-glutamate methylesterase [Oceanicoccus sp. KOV_DT_Chl]